MFKVSPVAQAGLNSYRITNLQNGEYISILPEYGCALNNFVLLKNGQQLDIIDGYSDSEDLVKNIHTIYKGHFLFPFPNRIYDGTYTLKGKKYQLKKNASSEGNALHGMVYDQNFSLKEISESEKEGSITFIKEVSGFDGYPFSCTVILSFKYNGRKLNMESEIQNNSSEEIPVGIGWHPYLRTGSDISEFSLEIPESYAWDSKSLTFLKSDPLMKGLIGQTHFDTCFKYDQTGKIILSDINKGIKMTIEIQKDLPYVQVYTPQHRKCLAIEPMSCVPDSFNNKIGLKLLGANETWAAGWSMEVSTT
jgi:aldose 1-epimerase